MASQIVAFWPEYLKTKTTKERQERQEKREKGKAKMIDGTKADRWDIMIRVAGIDHSMPQVVLITGASRGLGYGFVKNFLKFNDVKIVIGTVRNVNDLKKLSKIGDHRFQGVIMDVTDPKSILKAGKQISAIVGNDGINLLINNAGAFEPYDLTAKPNRELLQRQMMTNAIGPLLVVQTMLPMIRKAVKNSSASADEWSAPIGVGRGAVINIAPVQSSVTINNFGSNILGMADCSGYAMSKSALNQLTRGLSADLLPEGILVTSIMPGTVKTDLGGPAAQLTVDQACSLTINTLLKLQQHHSGQFISLQGNMIDF